MAVHGFDDRLRSVDVANLVTEASDAPVLSGLVDCGGDVGVEVGTLLQDVIE